MARPRFGLVLVFVLVFGFFFRVQQIHIRNGKNGNQVLRFRFVFGGSHSGFSQEEVRSDQSRHR